MNDKEYRHEISRIGKLKKWKNILGLWAWEMQVEFDRVGESFDNIGITARCFADWKYQNLTIIWNIPAVANLDDAGLEYAMVHELTHALIDPLAPADEEDNIDEFVATTVAKAILWSRDAGRKEK